MTFTQLRSQVNTLMRKYATRLDIYRARPMALELCDRMADAVIPGRPNPQLTCEDWAWNLFKRLRDRGIRVRSHVHLCNYLDRCLERLVLPQLNDVLRALFPKAASRGLIQRSLHKEIPFWPRRVWKHGMGYFIVALADELQANRSRGTWRKPNPEPLPFPMAFRYRPAAARLP